MNVGISYGAASEAEHRVGELDARVRSGLILAGLVLLGALLRFWRLGAWGLEGDEIFTLRDSLHPSLRNPRPLIYFLNHILIRPIAGLDEHGLRLLPAIFGVLAIPVIYFMGRRLVGSISALFAALLVTVSPFHVYQSQYARYWSLVFLLAAAYPYAIYVGIRDHSLRWLISGVVLALLAVLAHPVAILPAAGLALFYLISLRHDIVARLRTDALLRWFGVAVLILGLVLAIRSFSMLQNWIHAHDVKNRLPERLFNPKQPGLRQLGILASYVDYMTVPVVLSGVLGIGILARRDRPLALLLSWVSIVPVVIILLISFRAPISTNYLLPAAPALFLAAGVFLGRLVEIDIGVRPRWLAPAVIGIIVIAAGMPTLISQYRDGRRFDFRGAARWLETQMAPGDMVIAEQYPVLVHYLRDREVRHISPDTAVIAGYARELRQAGQGGALWVVAPAPSHAFRVNLKQLGVTGWIYQNCQLRNTLGRARVDVRQYYLQIYRCPPMTSQVGRAAVPAQVDSVAGRSSPRRVRTSR